MMRSERSAARDRSVVLASVMSTLTLLFTACAGGGDAVTGPPQSDTNKPASVTVAAGADQIQRVGTALVRAPSVIVKNASGAPLSGKAVTFAVTAGGGTITGAQTTTDEQGVASVGSWILGQTHGTQTLSASVGGTSLSTAISAVARYPYWTVAVYMAADNNLATFGVLDIEEMEAATRDPEIQVVVEAEFSPSALGQYGCGAPNCLGLSTFNTFRYELANSAAARLGPDGPVTDIGNRDMTDPAELTAFIQWARATAPSEHLLLVPWNHGGGYTGLLSDETSAPGRSMNMSELRSALQGAGGSVDVVDFDMCLMAGYETLLALKGVATYAVFSEETTPGEGNDYTGMLTALRGADLTKPATVAATVANAFNASYQGDRNSTTISAYDVSALGAFDHALSSLASHLGADVGTYGPLVAQSGAYAQRFELGELVDVLDFADSLRTRISDAAIRSDLDALSTAGTAATFRLRDYERNGTGLGLGGTADVSRATGLHVLLPDVTTAPTMQDAGPASLPNYEAMFGTTAWAKFLAAYMAAETPIYVTDLGTERLETYLLWSSGAQSSGVDIDLWVLEPNGEIASPYYGTVSPNGTLTGDSYASGYPVEGYLTNRYVQNGTYVWYAWLVTDPQGYRPEVEFVYRYGTAPFASVFGAGPHPALSFGASVLDDATPTFAEANLGAYTDLQPVAYVTFGDAATGNQIAAGPPLRLGLTRANRDGQVASRGGQLVGATAAQIETIHSLVQLRRTGRRFAPTRGMARIKAPEAVLARRPQ